MKELLKLSLFVCLVVLVSCGKPAPEAGEAVNNKDANKALYDQVMDIHDEVMPEMDNLYRLKKSLQDTIATPSLSEEKKKEFAARIQFIDSASNSMMVWMRQFNPPADSVQSEEYRVYMEQQLEKVKNVKAVMLEALAKGKN